MSWQEIELVKISDEQIKNSIDNMLQNLWTNDKYLLSTDVNEVTITQRMGAYLQSEFESYHVDCEYNRDGTETKRSDGEIVKPDIIVHHRGTNDNYLVIEVKKSNNSACEKDLDKTKAYLGAPLEYQFALYMEFNSDFENYNNFINRIEFYAR